MIRWLVWFALIMLAVAVVPSLVLLAGAVFVVARMARLGWGT